WQTARDLADELRWIGEAGAEATAGMPETKTRRGMGLALVLVPLLLAFAVGVLWQARRVERPPSWTGTMLGGPAIALQPRISPDGQMLAFQALVDGLNQTDFHYA